MQTRNTLLARIVHQHSALFLLFLCCMFSSASAWGQGTMQMLPDPITSGELMHYSDRLGLSGEQRRAAHSIHDEYLESFRHLREGEIEDMLQKVRELQRNMTVMPDRQTLEDLFSHGERLQRRIAQLDDQMFANLHPILTERQSQRLARVRLARERRRLTFAMTSMPIGHNIADLSRILLQLDLPRAELDEIDLILEPYEHRLTRDFRRLTEDGIAITFASFDVLSEIGVTQEDFGDFQRMQEVMEQVQQRMLGREKSFRDRNAALLRYNIQIARQVQAMLPDHEGRVLWHRFVQQTFPQSHPILHTAAERRIDAAMFDSHLTRDQQAQLEAALIEIRESRNRILDDLIRIAIDHLSNRSTFVFDPDQWQEYNSRIAEKHQDARNLDDRAKQIVSAVLGDDRHDAREEHLRRVESQYRRQIFEDSEPTAAVDASAEGGKESAATRTPRRDQFLPGEITRADTSRYARMLDLNDDQQALVAEMYALYIETFESIDKNEVAAVVEANRFRWTDPSEAAIQDLYRLRALAMERIRATDAAYFIDLETALFGEDGHPQMRRIRAMRDRVVYSAAQQTMMMYGQNRESVQDLVLIARSAEMHQVDRGRMASATEQYELQLAALLAEGYAQTLAIQKHSELWQYRMFRRSSENPSSTINPQDELRENLRQHQTLLLDTRQAIIELNRETLRMLGTVISPEAHQKLENTYMRQSYPDAYRDATAVKTHIEAAMNLPDLTEDQRSQLRELVLKYHPEYRRLTEALIEIQREVGTVMMMYLGGTPDPEMIDYIDRQQQTERITFERTELNSRAIMELRAILREDQIDRIGELPNPETRQRHSIY